jgi:4-carboxymuconolactone decarboxylase
MPSRLPSLRPADLDDAQRTLYDSLVVSEVPWASRSSVQTTASDGSLLGPFNALLFNPVLGAAQLAVFRADKASTSLPARLHEIVVLTVGGAWNSKYEIYAHSAMASRAGLPETVIGALASGDPIELDSEDETTAHRIAWQLAHAHRIESPIYERAVQIFGHKGVVDIVMLVGLYMTACAIINAFEVPVPHQ